MTHIRMPSRRTFRQSSSGFVRRGEIVGGRETLCGAPVTDRDCSAREWTAYAKAGEDVCHACITIVGANR